MCTQASVSGDAAGQEREYSRTSVGIPTLLESAEAVLRGSTLLGRIPHLGHLVGLVFGSLASSRGGRGLGRRGISLAKCLGSRRAATQESAGFNIDRSSIEHLDDD